MVTVVVVDADSKFLKEFKQMCKALGVIFWPLASEQVTIYCNAMVFSIARFLV